MIAGGPVIVSRGDPASVTTCRFAACRAQILRNRRTGLCSVHEKNADDDVRKAGVPVPKRGGKRGR